MAFPLPSSESARLRALEHYGIIDSAAEQSYDDLTLLASHICGTPIALLTFIDAARQWFKSKIGVDATEVPRDLALCSHAILQPEMMIVPDALLDARFATNPLVTSDPHVRFYAGTPLLTHDGLALGTLCVIDRVPRQLTADQAEALRALSRQVAMLLELRRLNVDLRASEERWRVRTENTFDYVSELDADGRYLYTSPQFRFGLGWEPDALIGKGALDLVHPDDHLAVAAIFREAVASGKPGVAEARWRHADGTWRWIESIGQPFRAAEGELHLSVIGRDVTARKDLDRQRTDFLAMLAHDIRNPLAIISGSVEILRLTGAIQPEIEEHFAPIERGTDRLLNLVTNYLDLSKIEAGELTLHCKPCDLNDVLAQVVKQYAVEARRRRVTLELQTDPSLPLLTADRLALERVFANLAGNALKFTPDGGTIVVRSRREAAQAVVTVTNSGPGIAAEEIPSLFGRYKQTATGQQKKGSGMGLFIVKSIVEAHSGTVEVESRVDSETTFAVCLPIG